VISSGTIQGSDHRMAAKMRINKNGASHQRDAPQDQQELTVPAASTTAGAATASTSTASSRPTTTATAGPSATALSAATLPAATSAARSTTPAHAATAALTAAATTPLAAATATLGAEPIFRISHSTTLRSCLLQARQNQCI